jgi:hypothetical protein
MFPEDMGASQVVREKPTLEITMLGLALYSDYILTRLNDTRSYVVAGIRQSAFDIMNDALPRTMLI